MAMFSNYLENKFVDFLFRGLAFTAPTQLNVALYTVAPTAAGGGTEVSGGSYARVNLAPSLANWAATNGAGSTVNPSTGTSGTTSNNIAITFPTPTANWGSIVAIGLFDQTTNLLFFGNLSTAKTVNNGDPAPLFNISALTFTVT